MNMEAIIEFIADGRGPFAVIAVLFFMQLNKTLEKLSSQIELNTIILARLGGLDYEEEKKRVAKPKRGD